MKRICVIGCGGAGKSTFANKLAHKIQLPIYHLDTIFYEPNWVEVERDVFDERLQKILNLNEWIIDGNFKRTMLLRFNHSDTIIFLDYPTWRSVYGVLKRIATDYGKHRKDMANGCTESFDWEFLKFVIGFNKKQRPEILKNLAQFEDKCSIHTFKSSKEAQNWLNRVN